MNKTKKIITLGLSCLSILTLVACSGTAKENNSITKIDKPQTSSIQKAPEKKEKYSIGDKITFENIAEFTFTNVEWSDKRNQFDYTHPDKVLKVTYNVTNLSDKDYYVGMERLELYVDGEKMDLYPNKVTFETLPPGKSFEGAIRHFGINGDGNSEFEITPYLSFNDEIIPKPAIVAFKLD